MARADYESLTRDELPAVIERLEDRIAQQDNHIKQQDAHIKQQDARIERLERLLDESKRGGKRQAAPFSKGPPKSNPKTPGRKSGNSHGKHSHRRPPTTPPDEIIVVPAPKECPDCGGAVKDEKVAHQHQIEAFQKLTNHDKHPRRCY